MGEDIPPAFQKACAGHYAEAGWWGKSGSSWRAVKSSLNVVGTEGLSGAAGGRVGA